MFAVIKTGGRQYRVVPDDVLEIGKIAGDVGTIVQLGEVLVVGGDTPVLGVPMVAGATVAAEVLDHKRGHDQRNTRTVDDAAVDVAAKAVRAHAIGKRARGAVIIANGLFVAGRT